jgi:hypothetical protein
MGGYQLEVELVAEMGPMPVPETSAVLIFAALSASIETTLVEFFKTELGIPARPGLGEELMGKEA